MPRAKTVAKIDGMKYLAPAPDDKVFWNHDGAVFKDMADLAVGLNNMSDETFSYHVTDEKNDYANWVKDVLGDETLATQLYRANNRQNAAAKVSQRVAQLRK